MHKITAAKVAVAGTALAAMSLGGAAAAVAMSADDTGTTPTVVNKNGHEVNEHAAKGQQRAAEARAQQLNDSTETPESDPADDDQLPGDEADEQGDDNGDQGDQGDAADDDQGDNDQGDQGDAADDDQGENDQGDAADGDQGDQGDQGNDHADEGDNNQGDDDQGDDDQGDDGDN